MNLRQNQSLTPGWSPGASKCAPAQGMGTKHFFLCGVSMCLVCMHVCMHVRVAGWRCECAGAHSYVCMSREEIDIRYHPLCSFHHQGQSLSLNRELSDILWVLAIWTLVQILSWPNSQPHARRFSPAPHLVGGPLLAPAGWMPAHWGVRRGLGTSCSLPPLWWAVLRSSSRSLWPRHSHQSC